MEYDPFDVFDIVGTAEQRRVEAPEHLVYDVAITLNIPFCRKEYSTMSLLQKIDTYKTIWQNITAEYNAERSHYVVEFCKSGQPHIHGTIRIKLIANYEFMDRAEIAKMIAKSIFLKLNKNLYKQFGKAKINTAWGIFDSPAVYIKVPYVLSTGWEEYQLKNEPRSN